MHDSVCVCVHSSSESVFPSAKIENDELPLFLFDSAPGPQELHGIH